MRQTRKGGKKKKKRNRKKMEEGGNKKGEKNKGEIKTDDTLVTTYL